MPFNDFEGIDFDRMRLKEIEEKNYRRELKELETRKLAAKRVVRNAIAKAKKDIGLIAESTREYQLINDSIDLLIATIKKTYNMH